MRIKSGNIVRIGGKRPVNSIGQFSDTDLMPSVAMDLLGSGVKRMTGTFERCDLAKSQYRTSISSLIGSACKDGRL